MLETASREIRRAAETADRERQEAGRYAALVAAIDSLLFELEELNLRDIRLAPVDMRERAAELIAQALQRPSPPVLPASVTKIMDGLYDAQEMAMLRRRRAGWGMDDLPAAASS